MSDRKWHELASASPYQTAVAVASALRAGDVSNATTGIAELIEALARSEKRALKSQLSRLMLHIIKWKAQPERRSRAWLATIDNARDEITDIREETPSLARPVLEALWDKCFRVAQRDAEAEMNQPSPVASLSWEAVFETDYRPEFEAGAS